MAAANDESVILQASKEGPVLNFMSKRLRALKKKYNKILQIEESKAQGKTINKEQEDVLKSKVSVAVLIEEYEKLRSPLQVAVNEELTEKEKELLSEGNAKPQPEPENNDLGDGDSDARYDSSTQLQDAGNDENSSKEGASEKKSYGDDSIADLLTIIYFAQLFDVKSHGESQWLMWSKAHERSSCLSYDCVTEDSPSPLQESDLDDISHFGHLLTSRAPNATLSHKDAIMQCVEHAKLWLQNSESTVRDGVKITYSQLRERLDKILSSHYFTMVPELQSALSATTVATQYEPEVPTGVLLHPQQVQLLPSQTSGEHGNHHLPVNNVVALSVEDAVAPLLETTIGDQVIKVTTTATYPVTCNGLPSIEVKQQDSNATTNGVEHEESISPQDENQETQDSQVPYITVGPRGSHGHKANGRGNVRGGGRGYGNGRGGGRGSGRGGGYANGRGGQYYDQGGYYQRNYNGRGRGRASRGSGASYHGNDMGQVNRASVNTPA